MRHITLEDILIGDLSEEQLEHIKECKKCQELYNTFNLQISQDTLEIIDQRVKEAITLKFKEMKTLGKLNKEIYETTKPNIIKYALVSVFSVLIITTAAIIITLINLGNIKSFETSLEGNNIKLIGQKIVPNITLNYENKTLIISLPEIKNGTIIISPSSNVEKISLRIGTNEYLFLAKETKLQIVEGKPVFDDETKIIKKPVNVIYLKNGEIFEGKLIEIKGDIIIFETTSGVKEFKKSDVEKIRYSD